MTTTSRLFTGKALVALERPTEKKLISHLEGRVSSLALSVIAGFSMTVGVSTFLLSALIIGVNPTTLILSSLFLSVGLVALYVMKTMKKYHEAPCIQTYREHSYETFKVFEFLDSLNYFEQKELKKAILRPLSNLEGEFNHFSNIFKYRLLQPKDFKEAFILETKYMDLEETLNFYQQIKKEYDVARSLDLTLPIYDFLDPEDLGKKFQEYIEANCLKKSPKVLWSFEDLKRADKMNECIMDHLDLLFKYGVFQGIDFDGILSKKEEFIAHKAAFYLNTSKSLAKANESQKKLDGIEEGIKKSYQMLEEYKEVERGQKKFFKLAKDIRKEGEERQQRLTEKFQVYKDAYLEDGQNAESILDVESRDQFKREEERHLKNVERLRKEQAERLKEFEKEITKFTDQAIKNLTEQQAKLREQKALPIAEGQAEFETNVSAFQSAHQNDILAYQKALVRFFKAYSVKRSLRNV